ncbi:MAG: GNAT family N-acetyltransferase [Archangium sp.]|nr:GNAT family N-acetyltransferase [Archangium sp.]
MIRPVETRDVAAVIELVRTTLGEFGIVFGEGADTDAQLAELPASYTDGGGAFFVAVDVEDLIGTAGIALVEPGLFELRKMYLRPGARGRGVGQLLFDACLAHVRAHGGRRIVLDTTEQMTAAIAFYERNGFVRDDTQRRAARCSRGYRRDLP